MRGLAEVVATGASALLCGLAFPPTGWQALAWIGVAPFLVVLRNASVRGAILVALLWTVVYWSVVWDWGPSAISDYFLQPRGVGLGFFAATAALMFAPYYAAFALAYRALARRRYAALPLLGAAAWVAAELARGRFFTGSAFFIGNPWAALGYSQVGFDALVQVASLAGVYGISFLLACANAALADLALELWRERRLSRGVATSLALGAAPAAGCLAFGLAVLPAPDTGQAADGTRVAVVQANLESTARWRSDRYGQNLDTYLRLTRDALLEDEPEVVFWPESSMTFFLEQEPLYRAAIGRLLSAAQVELVAGGPSRMHPLPVHYGNSVFLVGQDGEVRARYDKRVLLPFAEYLPFGRLDLFQRTFGEIREFTPGAAGPPLPTRAGAAGILICNEAMFPELAAQRVAEGASYLVNPSNDSWVSDAGYAAQQFDVVSLRAVEQRRYLIRASTTGPSAIVDPWGRTGERTEAFTRGVVTGRIRPATGPSVYGRVGDLFGVVCAIVVLGALAGPRARRGLRVLLAGERTGESGDQRSDHRPGDQVRAHSAEAAAWRGERHEGDGE